MNGAFIRDYLIQSGQYGQYKNKVYTTKKTYKRNKKHPGKDDEN